MRKIYVPLLVLFVYTSAFSQVLTVSNSGKSDYNVIQEAINNAPEGAIIQVEQGTYHEHILMKKGVSLVGVNNPIIDGDGWGTIVTMADSTLINGFTIINSGSERGITDCAILAWEDTNCIITNNIIKNNGHYGIVLYNSEALIYYNHIINNEILGIYFSYNARFDIAFNVISNHVHSAFNIGDNRIYGHIYNNVIDKNKYGFNYGNSNNLYYSSFNNILTNNEYAFFYPDSLDLSYNCFYNNKYNYWNWADDVQVGLDTTNIFSDPLFVDTANNNFRVSLISPGIKSGLDKTNMGIGVIENKKAKSKKESVKSKRTIVLKGNIISSLENVKKKKITCTLYTDDGVNYVCIIKSKLSALNNLKMYGTKISESSDNSISIKFDNFSHDMKSAKLIRSKTLYSAQLAINEEYAEGKYVIISPFSKEIPNGFFTFKKVIKKSN